MLTSLALMNYRSFPITTLWVLMAFAAMFVAASQTCNVVINDTANAGTQLEDALSKCDSSVWTICFGEGVFTGFAPNGTVLATPTGATLEITTNAHNPAHAPTLDFTGGQGFIINSGFTYLQSLNIKNGVSQGDGGCLNVIGGEFEMTSVTLSNCVSEAGNGGAIAVSTNSYWYLTSVTIDSSSAKKGEGGGLYVQVPAVVPGVIELIFVCSNNLASAGGGVALSGNPSTQARYTLHYTATNNTATSGNGGALLVSTPPSNGTNKIHVTIPTLYSLFLSNSAAGNGGALALINVGATIMSVFHFNAAEGAGGACYLSGSKVVVASNVTSNVASSGGAIAAEGGGSLELHISYFQYNQATNGSGGAVFVSGTPFSVKLGIFEENVASQDGGGMYVEEITSSVVLTGVFMMINNASGFGGSFCLVNGGGAALFDVGAALSKARAGGGLAFINAGPVSINGSSIELALEGSGIFITGPTTKLVMGHSMVALNERAGINCTGGSTVAINSVTNLLCSNEGPENLVCDATCSGCSSYSPPGGATTCGAQCLADPTLCIPNEGVLFSSSCDYCPNSFPTASSSSFTDSDVF